MKKLSILIPSVKRHSKYLKYLLSELGSQAFPFADSVEILVDESVLPFCVEDNVPFRSRVPVDATVLSACVGDDVAKISITDTLERVLSA